MLFEWRIQDVERKAEQAINRLHELDALRSDLGRLECANREISAMADGLRNELEAQTERITRLEILIEEIVAGKGEVK